MKTPAGNECKYFYGDYYRGRNHEECRLLQASGQNWSPELCRTCPVPGILQANACEFLKLHAVVAHPLSAVFQRRVQVTASCEKSGRAVREAQIGCGECHTLPPVFRIKE